MLSMTKANLCVIAATGARGEKVGSEEVHLEDRVTCMETHIGEDINIVWQDKK